MNGPENSTPMAGWNEADDMCPNCVTPWKCNGPHLADQTRWAKVLRSRRGRTARSYGTRAELKVARQYGGTKVGHMGGPVDVQGVDWDTQIKTHRRLPPAEWRKAFAAMTGTERLPRLLLRFLPGPGLPPMDYIVVPGAAWLDWWGKDEA